MTHSMLTAPAITVLMSCYNAARWLDEAIKSVLNQTYCNFEFLIVDDGSEDDTLKIIKRYADQDTRIAFIAKHNTGLADSLNLGIREARGKWIARLDADDVCEPSRLEKQFDLARENPALVFIGTGLTMIDQNGAELRDYRYPSRHASLLKHLRTSRRFPPHSSAFYRTEVVRAVGSYRTRIRRAQDWDLWFRLSEVGELACIDESLVKIRKHSSQISHDESGKRQKLYSRIAMTSYWLRQYGFPDPVSDVEERFEVFRIWIEKRLEEEALFISEYFMDQSRKMFYGAPKSPTGALKLFGMALRHPVIVLYQLRQRVFGDQLPRRLAQEWMSQSDSVPG